MTIARATRPGPETPTPASSEPIAGSDIPVSPQVLDALSSDRRPASSLPATPSDAGGGSGWDIVEEWGVQSFPASDPPANW